MTDKKEPIRIYREPVVGYLVVKRQDEDDKGLSTIILEPFVGIKEGIDEIFLHDDEDYSIIGVLPSQPGTYRVYGVLKGEPDREDDMELGYEYNGIPNPDWENQSKVSYEKRYQKKH